jgi:hypothetical protein
MEDIIKLNIGGKTFTTTLETLKKRGENLITSIIGLDRENTNNVVPKDEIGSYFFDRSPDLFKIILEFLRTGEMYASTYFTKDQIEKEFEFYQINMKSASPSSDLSVYLFERSILMKGVEDSARAWLLEHSKEILKKEFILDYETVFRIYTTITPFSNVLLFPKEYDQSDAWIATLCKIITNEWGIKATWGIHPYVYSNARHICWAITLQWFGQKEEVIDLLKSWQRSGTDGNIVAVSYGTENLLNSCRRTWYDSWLSTPARYPVAKARY